MNVFCDCCGKEKLAEIKDGKLIIYDRRHGQRHFVVLSIQSLRVDPLTTTTDSAIREPIK